MINVIIHHGSFVKHLAHAGYVGKIWCVNCIDPQVNTATKCTGHRGPANIAPLLYGKQLAAVLVRPVACCIKINPRERPGDGNRVSARCGIGVGNVTGHIRIGHPIAPIDIKKITSTRCRNGNLVIIGSSRVVRFPGGDKRILVLNCFCSGWTE